MQSFKTNTEFSKLSNKELHFFLIDLRDFYLKVRSTLNLKDKVTFGIEIEADKGNPKDLYFDALSKGLNFFNFAVMDKTLYNEEIYLNKKLLKNWNIDKEIDPASAIEIISPILKDTPKTWKELVIVCDLLKNNKVEINEKVGAHIHVGAHVMKDLNSWVNFLKLWAVYENIIYRFACGENLNYRAYLKEYANPIRNKIINNIEKNTEFDHVFSLIDAVGMKEMQEIGLDLHRIMYFYKNIFSRDNTIEIRCPNGTIKPEIWQNNINFFIKLILYANSDNFDTDYINSEFKNLTESNMLNTYNKLDLKNALILCDLIFNSDEDKISFLKQYYKDGLERNDFEDTVKLALN